MSFPMIPQTTIETTDTTEKWCQERAIYLSRLWSLSRLLTDKIPNAIKALFRPFFRRALGVSFDSHVGHDYVSDAQARFDFYHRKEDKIPFNLSMFDKITKGGLVNKSLNIALAGTGVGKSLFMCHLASSVLLQGRMFCTSLWRWQKKRLLRGLMQTF